MSRTKINSFPPRSESPRGRVRGRDLGLLLLDQEVAQQPIVDDDHGGHVEAAAAVAVVAMARLCFASVVTECTSFVAASRKILVGWGGLDKNRIFRGFLIGTKIVFEGHFWIFVVALIVIDVSLGFPVGFDTGSYCGSRFTSGLNGFLARRRKKDVVSVLVAV